MARNRFVSSKHFLLLLRLAAGEKVKNHLKRIKNHKNLHAAGRHHLPIPHDGNADGEVAPDTFLITFVELGRFRKKSMADVRTRLEWICYLFNNPGEMGRVLEAADDDFIRDFTRACNVAGFTPQKKIQYESTMMNEMDYRAIIQFREKKGRQEGRQEGEKEKAISIARKMLEMDMDVNTIATATGLTPQAIEDLKNSARFEGSTELQE